MSGTIWLITEDENDYKVVKAILKKLNLALRIKWLTPSGKTPGLSRLAAELKQLIADAQNRIAGNDCIVVLHDEDSNQQKRDHYNQVRDICRSHRVKLIVAQDEIEAWLLSDSGVCEWLKIPVRTWNGDPRPSDNLRSAMDKNKLRYPRDIDKLLIYINADGMNQSFQNALAALYGAPCVNGS